MPSRDPEKNRASVKKHYYSHKEYYYEKNRRNQLRIRQWYYDYKKNLSCMKCGENHPACLEFHHRNPADKDREIIKMVWSCVGIKRIMAEIDKCDVLCANCHRKTHYELKQELLA